jgi:predicted Zn-dependent protease
LLCLIALIVGWFAYSKYGPQPASVWTSAAPKIQGSKIYFVPIGDFPTESLQPLVRYYREKYNLEIVALTGISVDAASRDQSRQQLMAERLASGIRNSVPAAAQDQKAILIGFTSEDIYPASKGWQFAFGWRLVDEDAAVVSTARLSLPSEAATSDADLSATRLRKIVTKDIGILYYGLPQSPNSNSVLYSQIMGIDELDQVGEDF